MSANPFLAENKIAIHFAQLLNISIDDELSMMDMEDELSTIGDLVGFRKYVKNRFNYSSYQFMTGYQKFIALAKDFRVDNKPKLDQETEMKVYNYTTRLLSKITNFAFALNFEVQEKGYDLKTIKMDKTFEKVLNEKDIEICKIIGFNAIYDLAIRNIPKLETELEKAITQKALITKYPQLANNKKEFEGMGTIKKLKMGSKK
ncbi:hypothetical protein NG774_04005 [Aliarcobacter cryaerophilus]|uniref:hypothetical protein n=1 Tax=Aliarcobacter cryaerophilus TaxID=28198 RepID=UPI003DA4CCBE